MSWHGRERDGHRGQLVRIGLDATSVSRWRTTLARTPAVRGIAFAAAERDWAGDRPERYALLWAAKESVVKAAGCGFDGLSWRDVLIDSRSATAVLAGRRTRWRLRWERRGDHVVALAQNRPAPARVAVVRELCDARCGYADRSARTRALAEDIARDAGDVRELRWGESVSGAPTLVIDGERTAVSLTHGDGLCGAALVVPARWTQVNQSATLIVSDSAYMLG